MKTFRLYALSKNRNNFGLRRAIMVAQEGEAWKVLTDDVNCPVKEWTYEVEGYNFAAHGWECAEPLPDPPPEVKRQMLEETWSDAPEEEPILKQPIGSLIQKATHVREFAVTLMADLEADQHYDGLTGAVQKCLFAHVRTNVRQLSSVIAMLEKHQK